MTEEIREFKFVTHAQNRETQNTRNSTRNT